jgi:hypothetical protein
MLHIYARYAGNIAATVLVIVVIAAAVWLVR